MNALLMTIALLLAGCTGTREGAYAAHGAALSASGAPRLSS